MKKRIKKSISLFFVAVMLVFGLSAVGLTFEVSAYDGTEYGNTGMYYEIRGNEAVIIDADYDITTADIPESIEGCPVTEIGDEAFEECWKLTSITIGSSVTSIGEDAFYYCIQLENIWVAENNSKYSSLNGVLFDKDKTALLKYPAGRTDATYIIPHDVTSIGDNAFEFCSNLTSVTIPEGVTTIGSAAFYSCENLTDISIPYGVTNIRSQLFLGCGRLKNIEIPNSIIKIDKYAFYGCSSLTNIAIPNSVEEIGASVFYNCSSLTNITVDKDNPNYSGLNGVLFNKNQTELIQYPTGASGEYVVPSSVICIGDSAFYGCGNLTGIVIPKSVEKIGDYAFCECLALKSVTVQGSELRSIGAGSFCFCRNLTDIKLSDGVTVIGDSAFSHCNSLKEIQIPDSVTQIGKGAFYSCTNLVNVAMSKNIQSISEGMFCECSKLKSITISEKVTSIENYAFDGCDSLTIYGYSGSTAERYAFDNGFMFVALTHTHSYTTTVEKEATCTKDGVRKFTCSCGDSYTESIPALAHTSVTDKAVAATCTKTGLTEGSHCSACGKVLVAQKTTKALAHKLKTTTTKATSSKDGKSVTSCTACGKAVKTAIIYKASSVKLSKTAYTYNGKAQKPTVTVKNSKGEKLKEGKDYTVKYQSGRKKPGKYTVTITFKGDYSGTKTLSFTIAPKAPTLKAKAGAKKATLSWNKQTGATGYNVYMATKKNGKYKKIGTVKNGKLTYTKSGLTKGKTYYFKVAAYTVSGGKTISGAYSSVKSAKVK